MPSLNDFSPGGQQIDLTAGDYIATRPVGIYVGTAGDVRIEAYEGDLLVQAQAGAVLPWAVRRVYQSGTTASGLISVRLT